MNFSELLHTSFAHTLGWALLHSLWQVAVVAALLALALWLLGRASPQWRYAACGLAMMLVMVLPVASFWLVSTSGPSMESPGVAAGLFPSGFQDPQENPAGQAGRGPRYQPAADGSVSQLAADVASATSEVTMRREAAMAAGAMVVPTVEPSLVRDLRPVASPPISAASAEPGPSGPRWLVPDVEFALPWAVGAWLAGVLALSLWRAGGWIAVERLRVVGIRPVGDETRSLAARLAARMGLSRRVRLVRSVVTDTPLVVGLLRPTILLPAALLTGLSPEQLEAILAHELAHVRRHDYLANLLQTIVETLLFYHPAVWWISRRMRLEREHCCDDVAAGLCGDRIGYAEALAAVEGARAAVPTLAMAARRANQGDFVRRIGRLLGMTDVSAAGAASRSLVGMLGIVVVLAVAIGAQLLGGPELASPAEAAEAGSNAEPAAPNAAEMAKLRYEIELKASDIGAGRALGLEARLYNDGEKAVAVPWGSTAFDDMFCFTIIDGEGRLLARPTNRLAPPLELAAKAIVTVPPHGKVSYDIFLGTLGRNCQRWYFRAPGTYSVSASYVNRIDSYVDPETGQTVKIPNAWTGTLEAKPFEFGVWPSEEVSGPINITGKVTDPEGKPISGALVIINGLQPFDDMWGGDSIKGAWRETIFDQQFTAADGTFAFGSLPDAPAAYRLDAQHAEHVQASTTVERKPPKTDYETKIVMDPGATIRGRVVDPEGRPIEGVSARSYPADKSPYTDADGRFTIAGVPPDALHMDFWRPGYSMIDAAVPDLQEAASGEWTVRMTPNNALKFSGVALLADGKPLAKREIEFWLKNDEGRSNSVRGVTTDAQGRFEATLSGPGPYHGNVWTKDRSWQAVLTDRFHPALDRRWRAPVADVRPGSQVTVTFANDRVVEMGVEPDGTLPDGMTLAALLQMGTPPDGRWQQANAQGEIGPKAEVVRFDQLSPGDYMIRLFATNNEGLGWEKKFTIPETGSEKVTKVAFRLPRLETGSAKLRVVDSRGNPVSDAEGSWYGASSSNGKFPVVNGAARFDGALTGTAFIRVRKGPLFGEIAARIEAGKETDAGTLVLEPEDRGHARVKGRFFFEDGSYAFGIKVAGQGIDKEGAFDVQNLTAAKRLMIDLSDAHGWLKEGVPSSEYERPAGRNQFASEGIILPLAMEPGSVVERDIIIDRSHRRTVTLVWRGELPKEPYFSLSVDRALYAPPEGATSGSGIDEVPPLTSGQDQPSVYFCNGWARLHVEGLATLTELADGKGTLFLRADDYIGYMPVDEGDQTVVFDRTQTGTIEGRVVRADGSPAGGISVGVEPTDGRPDDSVAGVGYVGMIGISRGTTTAADGTFRFDSVGPGQYRLSTHAAIDQPTQTVEVRTGEASRVELESAANPNRVPPLRPDAE